jgi:hypothetical protein
LDRDAVSAVQALRTARAAGIKLRVDGEALTLEADSPPHADVVEMLSLNKPALVILLRPRRDGRAVPDWKAFFNQRMAIAELDGLPRREAEAHGFRACVTEWLNRNPVHSMPERCCWCGAAEESTEVLLPFGIAPTGHAWLHNRCWQPWHKNRHAQAIAFLRGRGISVPDDFPDYFVKKGGA